MRVLAVDIGTTSAKAAIVEDGTIVDVAESPIELRHPHPGWAEQDAEQWWAAAVAAVRAVRERARGDLRVDALACTGQMQDLVPLGADGRPTRPVILYSDQRAVAEHTMLADRLGPAWADAALAEPDATNVAAKWAWVAAHEPSAADATRTVLFGGGAYVVWRACGTATSDPTTAATTGLADVRAGEWWAPVVEAAGLEGRMPAMVGAGTVAGTLTAGAATELGLPTGLPVVHASGDAVATSVGVLGSVADVPYAYLGTSGWVGVFRPAPSPAPGIIVLPGPAPDRWISVAPVLTAGGAADWAREQLLGGPDHEAFDRLAGSACAAAEGVLFLPHLDGCRAPDADPFATGTLVGARRSTSAAVVAAAIYEGVAHSLAAIADLVAPGSHDVSVCGGGSRSDVWCQVIADVTGCTVRRVSDDHASLRGAASCAHVALGRGALGPATTLAAFTPRPAERAAHAAVASTFRALGPTLAGPFSALAAARSANSQ